MDPERLIMSSDFFLTFFVLHIVGWLDKQSEQVSQQLTSKVFCVHIVLGEREHLL